MCITACGDGNGGETPEPTKPCSQATCEAEGKTCDYVNNVCVDCIDNTDCAAPNPVCHNNTCVECTEQGGGCISSEKCVENKCVPNVECSDEVACPNDGICGTDGKCLTSQSVDCADLATSEIPANAAQVEAKVTITWTAEDGWSPIAKCAWKCGENYGPNADATGCLRTKCSVNDDCTDQGCVADTCKSETTNNCDEDTTPAKPTDATATNAIVTVTWDKAAKAWTAPAKCEWTCPADKPNLDADKNACVAGPVDCTAENYSTACAAGHYCKIEGEATTGTCTAKVCASNTVCFQVAEANDAICTEFDGNKPGTITACPTETPVCQVTGGVAACVAAPVVTVCDMGDCKLGTEGAILVCNDARTAFEAGTCGEKVCNATGTEIGACIDKCTENNCRTNDDDKTEICQETGLWAEQDCSSGTSCIIADEATEGTCQCAANTCNGNQICTDGMFADCPTAGEACRESTTDGTTVGSCISVPQVFFSEYVEGSDNNKAIEIYNAGETAAICSIQLRSQKGIVQGNGSGNFTVQPKNTYVICNAQSGPTLKALCNSAAAPQASVTTFNGDDSLELTCSGQLVDVFGYTKATAQAQNNKWRCENGVSAENKTLQRKCAVTGNISDVIDFPSLCTEWDAYEIDDYSDIGKHTFECPTACTTVGCNDNVYCASNGAMPQVCLAPTTCNSELGCIDCLDDSQCENSGGEYCSAGHECKAKICSQACYNTGGSFGGGFENACTDFGAGQPGTSTMCWNSETQTAMHCLPNADATAGSCVACTSNDHCASELCNADNTCATENTKTVDCAQRSIPDHATANVVQVTINFADGKWTETPSCKWTCNDTEAGTNGWIPNADGISCVEKCAANSCDSDSAKNYCATSGKYEACGTGMGCLAGACLASQTNVACNLNGQVLPENGRWTNATVTLNWNDESGAWPAAPVCILGCNEGYDLNGSACVLSDKCANNTCNAGTQYCDSNTGNCVDYCGDGEVNNNEACDPEDTTFNTSCPTAWHTGSKSCSNTCTIVDNCDAPTLWCKTISGNSKLGINDTFNAEVQIYAAQGNKALTADYDSTTSPLKASLYYRTVTADGQNETYGDWLTVAGTFARQAGNTGNANDAVFSYAIDTLNLTEGDYDYVWGFEFGDGNTYYCSANADDQYVPPTDIASETVAYAELIVDNDWCDDNADCPTVGEYCDLRENSETANSCINYCGDGEVNNNEACDNSATLAIPEGTTCASVLENENWTGTLTCSDSCTIISTACVDLSLCENGGTICDNNLQCIDRVCKDGSLCENGGTTCSTEGETCVNDECIVDSHSAVVISQVYPAGGNSGSSLKTKYIELFNRSSMKIYLSSIVISGFSFSGGSSGTCTLQNISLEAGKYYLVSIDGKNDSENSIGADYSCKSKNNGGNGVISLSASKASISLKGTGDTVYDVVAYGSVTSNYVEGIASSAPTATQALSRRGGGCIDTDNNKADFEAVTIGSAEGQILPRNSSTEANVCKGTGPVLAEGKECNSDLFCASGICGENGMCATTKSAQCEGSPTDTNAQWANNGVTTAIWDVTNGWVVAACGTECKNTYHRESENGTCLSNTRSMKCDDTPTLSDENSEYVIANIDQTWDETNGNWQPAITACLTKCKSTHHAETGFDTCQKNTKTVSCTTNTEKAPQHAEWDTTQMITQNWVNNAWAPVDTVCRDWTCPDTTTKTDRGCAWNCNDGYQANITNTGCDKRCTEGNVATTCGLTSICDSSNICVACADGNHREGNVCVSNTKSAVCSNGQVTHGTWTPSSQYIIWDGTWPDVVCTLSCDSGYHKNDGSTGCNPDLVACTERTAPLPDYCNQNTTAQVGWNANDQNCPLTPMNEYYKLSEDHNSCVPICNDGHLVVGEECDTINGNAQFASASCGDWQTDKRTCSDTCEVGYGDSNYNVDNYCEDAAITCQTIIDEAVVLGIKDSVKTSIKILAVGGDEYLTGQNVTLPTSLTTTVYYKGVEDTTWKTKSGQLITNYVGGTGSESSYFEYTFTDNPVSDDRLSTGEYYVVWSFNLNETKYYCQTEDSEPVELTGDDTLDRAVTDADVYPATLMVNNTLCNENADCAPDKGCKTDLTPRECGPSQEMLCEMNPISNASGWNEDSAMAQWDTENNSWGDPACTPVCSDGFTLTDGACLCTPDQCNADGQICKSDGTAYINCTSNGETCIQSSSESTGICQVDSGADVVISQMYRDGGSTYYGADYVELFNRSQKDVDMAGWYLYSSGPRGGINEFSTSHSICPLTAATSGTEKTTIIRAGGHYLIKMFGGYSNNMTIDADCSIIPKPFSNSSGANSVGIPSTTSYGTLFLTTTVIPGTPEWNTQSWGAAQTCTGNDVITNSCVINESILNEEYMMDALGYRAGNQNPVAEGGTPITDLPAVTDIIVRKNACFDTNNNELDFEVKTLDSANGYNQATGAPLRNSVTPPNTCIGTGPYDSSDCNGDWHCEQNQVCGQLESLMICTSSGN